MGFHAPTLLTDAQIQGTPEQQLVSTIQLVPEGIILPQVIRDGQRGQRVYRPEKKDGVGDVAERQTGVLIHPAIAPRRKPGQADHIVWTRADRSVVIVSVFTLLRPGKPSLRQRSLDKNTAWVSNWARTNDTGSAGAGSAVG